MTDKIADNYEDDIWSSPAKIWKDINKRYETAVGYDAKHLQKELYQCKLEEEGTVLDYLNKIDGLCNKLKMCKNTPTEAQIIFHILDGLPDTQDWDTWTMVTEDTLKVLPEDDRLDELRTMLPVFEAKFRRKQFIIPGEALISKN